MKGKLTWKSAGLSAKKWRTAAHTRAIPALPLAEQRLTGSKGLPPLWRAKPASKVQAGLEERALFVCKESSRLAEI